MLTDLVVANVQEAQAVSASASRAAQWPCFCANGLDHAVLAALWLALDPQADVSGLEGDACLVFCQDDGGPWVFQLPDVWVEKVSAVAPASISDVAQRWVEQPELVHAGWSAADVAPAVEALVKIAATAKENAKPLLLWISL